MNSIYESEYSPNGFLNQIWDHHESFFGFYYLTSQLDAFYLSVEWLIICKVIFSLHYYDQDVENVEKTSYELRVVLY